MPFNQTGAINDMISLFQQTNGTDFASNLINAFSGYDILIDTLVSTMVPFPATPPILYEWVFVSKIESYIDNKILIDPTTDVFGFIDDDIKEVFIDALVEKAEKIGEGIDSGGLFTTVTPPLRTTLELIDMEKGLDGRFNTIKEGYEDLLNDITNWFRTGTATNNQTGVLVTWS